MITTIKVKLYQTDPGSLKVLLLSELPKKSTITDGMIAKLSWSDQRSTRKLSQNGLYWKFINEYCLPAIHSQFDPSMDAEEIHEILTRALLPQLKIINSKVYKSRKPTKELSVSDFADYFNKAIEFAGSEWNVPTELFIANYEKYKKEMGL